jgi:hypothetical protein
MSRYAHAGGILVSRVNLAAKLTANQLYFFPLLDIAFFMNEKLRLMFITVHTTFYGLLFKINQRNLFKA